MLLARAQGEIFQEGFQYRLLVDSRCRGLGRSPQPLRRLAFYNHHVMLKLTVQRHCITVLQLELSNVKMAICIRQKIAVVFSLVLRCQWYMEKNCAQVEVLNHKHKIDTIQLAILTLHIHQLMFLVHKHNDIMTYCFFLLQNAYQLTSFEY